MENNHAILENFKVQANVLMKVKAIQDTVYYVNLNVLYANLFAAFLVAKYCGMGEEQVQVGFCLITIVRTSSVSM